MNDFDEQRIAEILQADSRELTGRAGVPNANAILWRAKIRTRRNRSQRVVRLITLAEITGAGIAALVLIGLMWMTVLPVAVSVHAITVAVAAVLTTATLIVVVGAAANLSK